MQVFENPRGLRVPGHPVYAYVGPDIVCVRREGRGREGKSKREGERDGEDEDRGNGPLPGARVLRLRDITEYRSAASGWAGGW